MPDTGTDKSEFDAAFKEALGPRPEPSPGAKTEPDGEDGLPEPAANAEPEDEASGSDPDYKTLYEREAQRLKSLEGRYRKERERWRREADGRAGRPGLDREPDAPENAPPGRDDRDDRKDETVRAFLEQHPDMAEPLRLLARREALSIARPLIKTLEAQRHVRTIEAAHPDWKDLAGDPGLEEWIDSQPDYVADVLRDVVRSGSAAQVIDLLSHFKEARGVSAAKAGKAEAEARRERRARDAEAVRSRTAGPPKGRPDIEDFSSAWAEAVKRYR